MKLKLESKLNDGIGVGGGRVSNFLNSNSIGDVLMRLRRETKGSKKGRKGLCIVKYSKNCKIVK